MRWVVKAQDANLVMSLCPSGRDQYCVDGKLKGEWISRKFRTRDEAIKWMREVSGMEPKRMLPRQEEGMKSLDAAIEMMAYPRYPDDYTIELPIYSEDQNSDIHELYELLNGYYSGQWDPIYAVVSRGGRGGLSRDEVWEISHLLEQILDGKYGDPFKRKLEEGESEEEELAEGELEEEEQEDYANTDGEVAQSWLPTIERILKENPEPEEPEEEP